MFVRDRIVVLLSSIGSHGLELRVSCKGPLRDGFDIVVMESSANIETPSC